jgi:hypothetical protein
MQGLYDPALCKGQHNLILGEATSETILLGNESLTKDQLLSVLDCAISQTSKRPTSNMGLADLSD